MGNGSQNGESCATEEDRGVDRMRGRDIVELIQQASYLLCAW